MVSQSVDDLQLRYEEVQKGEHLSGVLRNDVACRRPLAIALAGHVREKLAPYKAPRDLVIVETIGRAPNGKVDYKRMKAYAADQLGISLD